MKFVYDQLYTVPFKNLSNGAAFLFTMPTNAEIYDRKVFAEVYLKTETYAIKSINGVECSDDAQMNLNAVVLGSGRLVYFEPTAMVIPISDDDTFVARKKCCDTCSVLEDYLECIK